MQISQHNGERSSSWETNYHWPRFFPSTSIGLISPLHDPLSTFVNRTKDYLPKFILFFFFFIILNFCLLTSLLFTSCWQSGEGSLVLVLTILSPGCKISFGMSRKGMRTVQVDIMYLSSCLPFHKNENQCLHLKDWSHRYQQVEGPQGRVYRLQRFPAWRRHTSTPGPPSSWCTPAHWTWGQWLWIN